MYRTLSQLAISAKPSRINTTDKLWMICSNTLAKSLSANSVNKVDAVDMAAPVGKTKLGVVNQGLPTRLVYRGTD
jgi:hypothetical protein